jgi:hypothetical protein
MTDAKKWFSYQTKVDTNIPGNILFGVGRLGTRHGATGINESEALNFFSLHSTVDAWLGSVFSFSDAGGESSYLRFAGTVDSGIGVGPCEVGSEGGREARASRGSDSGVRSMIE